MRRRLLRRRASRPFTTAGPCRSKSNPGSCVRNRDQFVLLLETSSRTGGEATEAWWRMGRLRRKEHVSAGCRRRLRGVNPRERGRELGTYAGKDHVSADCRRRLRGVNPRERGRESGAYAGKIMLAPTAVGGYGGVNPRERGRESGAYAGKIRLAPTAVGGYGG